MVSVDETIAASVHYKDDLKERNPHVICQGTKEQRRYVLCNGGFIF